MTNFARVVGGVVAEIIPGAGVPIASRFHRDLVAALVEVPAEVRPGWIWDGVQFGAPVAPSAPPPAPITARQLRLWLLSRGVSFTEVDAAIDDAPASEAARVEWEYGTVFARANPLIALICEAFGFNPEEMDAGFIAAAAL